ncbi:hypothetical protein [Embleya sp. MST-111070]|uniref:hypothetical protein n=1 Tax=Embleya sp. MST-111070 TaxID=3398231 RepID=UPI003F73E841
MSLVRVLCVFTWRSSDLKPGLVVHATGITDSYAVGAAERAARRFADEQCACCQHDLSLTASFRIPNDFPAQTAGESECPVLTAHGSLNP